MAVSNVLLVTRPDYDIVTKYFCIWSEALCTMARQKGMTVCDLQGKKANRKDFESYLRKNNPSMVFLNGHGNAEIITGQNDEPIVDAASMSPNSIMYARSCDAGERLGQELVRHGVSSFIGYRRKFIFGYTPEYVTRPVMDPMASLFLEPSNLIVSTLLKGHTAKDANQRSKDAMFRNFRKMICSTASFEERYASRWLWGNLQHQVLHGNEEAKI